MKQAKGKELIFISRILRDGSGVEAIPQSEIHKHWEDNTIFDLQCLSITQGTWIASENYSYVVKFKEAKNQP